MIYILHFEKRIGNPLNPKATAGHYAGATHDLQNRLLQHRTGFGAKIMKAVVERGIAWTVATTFPGGYDEEKILKLQKNTPRYCPICREQRLLEKMFKGGDDATA